MLWCRPIKHHDSLQRPQWDTLYVKYMFFLPTTNLSVSKTVESCCQREWFCFKTYFILFSLHYISPLYILAINVGSRGSHTSSLRHKRPFWLSGACSVGLPAPAVRTHILVRFRSRTHGQYEAGFRKYFKWIGDPTEQYSTCTSRTSPSNDRSHFGSIVAFEC